ncbi:MAG: flagellin, partial [Comamonas sp.]
MAATINTNIASINAQRNLAASGQSLNTTMQRLSSGLRVNSAKDDAAGLAIAERMNTQVKGLTVAGRNANDGISLAQTAEGALGKVGDMLQRMRELAVQASNATNSASDRVALQAEVSQLAAEIDRVAKQTNFNGQKILDGSFAGAVFQVGANSGDNVTLGALADTRSSKLSLVNYAQNTVSIGVSDNPTPAIKDYAVEIPAGELKITIGSTPPQEVALELIKPATSSLERLGQVVTAINNKSVDTGVTAYMSRDETTGEYSIQLMAEKTDAEGTPYSVNFSGFHATTTGIGGNYTSTLVPLATELPDRGNSTSGLTADVTDMEAATATPTPASPIPASLTNYVA